ncbi:MAG: acetate--CoA ligase family protein [Thermoplasmata archaeon]
MNLSKIFEVKRVCVIGASREPGKVGNVILRNLKRNFKGDIFAVHPSAEEIEGVRCYRSIDSIPGKIDLAVISLPAGKTMDVIKSLASSGCSFCIPIAGGFGEQGESGKSMEEEMRSIARESGMRIIGPNTVGVIIPRIGLNTALTTEEKSEFPVDGKVGFISQSGALGLLTMDEFTDLGVGFSAFFSLGNEADVDETDAIEALGSYDRTGSIALYLERISRVEQFLSKCREVSRHKGIVAMKGGRTESGNRATSLHTGSLMKTSFSLTSIFRQHGIVEASNEVELIDFASALALSRPVFGKRIAVVTSAGGVGVIATDLLERAGFSVKKPSEKLAGKIMKDISPIGSPFNPIDMTAEATDSQYEAVINDISDSGEYDAILAFVLFQTFGVTERIVDFLGKYVREGKLPIVVGTIGGLFSREMTRKLLASGVPTYPSVQRGISSLAALAERGKYLRRFANAD